MRPDDQSKYYIISVYIILLLPGKYQYCNLQKYFGFSTWIIFAENRYNINCLFLIIPYFTTLRIEKRDKKRRINLDLKNVYINSCLNTEVQIPSRSRQLATANKTNITNLDLWYFYFKVAHKATHTCGVKGICYR